MSGVSNVTRVQLIGTVDLVNVWMVGNFIEQQRHLVLAWTHTLLYFVVRSLLDVCGPSGSLLGRTELFCSAQGNVTVNSLHLKHMKYQMFSEPLLTDGVTDTWASAFTFSLAVSPLSHADMLSFPKGDWSGRKGPVFSLSLLLMGWIQQQKLEDIKVLTR